MPATFAKLPPAHHPASPPKAQTSLPETVRRALDRGDILAAAQAMCVAIDRGLASRVSLQDMQALYERALKALPPLPVDQASPNRVQGRVRRQYLAAMASALKHMPGADIAHLRNVTREAGYVNIVTKHFPPSTVSA